LYDITTPNAAQALRDAGFRPLPRLWVKNEDMVQIYSLINAVGLEVREIRQQARIAYEAEFPPKIVSDPINDKEAAWTAYEQAQNK